MNEHSEPPFTTEMPGDTHDWASEIIGYDPQSEPQWVTRFGYRPPIYKYTCKACGQQMTVGGSDLIFRLMYCPPCHEGKPIQPSQED